MAARNAAKLSEGVTRKTYRINPKVTVTRRDAEGNGGAAAYVKHGESGRLFRLAKEELYLLTALDAGQGAAEVAVSFQKEFGKSVRPQVIESFTRQMLGAGVLRRVDEAVVVAESTEDQPAGGAAPDAGTDEEPAEENGISDELEVAGEQLDDDMKQLEDMVFGSNGGPAAPRKPVGAEAGDDADKGTPAPETARKRPEPARPAEGAGKAAAPVAEETTKAAEDGDASSRGKGDGKFRSAARARAAAGDGGKADAGAARPAHTPRFTLGGGARPDAAAAAPQEPAAPGIADPAVAARKVRFRRNAGADGKSGARGMLRLFDPTAMLAALSATFGWWGRVSWLLYPLVLFAILIVFNRFSEYGLGIASGFRAVSRIAVVLISLLTVNLFTLVVTAVVAHRRGAEIRHFGITMVLFVLPRVAIDMSGVEKLDREGKLAVYSSTLKARLFLFAVATVIWAVTRRSGTMIPDIAIIVEQLALLTFLLTALPLLQGDGYKWMATYFNQPLLRQRAFNYVFGTSKKLAEFMPEPTKGEKWAFSIYAIGSALFTGMMVSLFVIYVSTALEGRFGGSGLVMFFGIVGLIFVWITVMKSSQREARKEAVKSAVMEKMAEARQEGAAGMGGGGRTGGALVPVPESAGALQTRGGALVRRPQMLPDRPRARPLAGVYADNSALQRRNRWLSRLLVVTALSALAYVAFLPYSYEVGGDFTILPDQRTSVSAKISGELEEILIDEGDVVEEGQLLARLSDWRPLHDVAAAQAELEKAQARLEKLLAGASEEDIQVAREQVAAAEADIPFKKAQAERAATLLERGTISETEADRLQSAYVVAEQDLRTAQANLARVEAPASEAEIKIAEAEIARLESDLEYKQGILWAVEIKAPVSGRIVTENVQLVRGQYLEIGELFVEIENHEVARAEVLVSETDIGLVEAGDQVRLKAWATSEAERVGQVIAIAPQAETEEFGRVVRVKTQFDNSNGFYRPGMTGFAKIEGAEMDTWQAFTRLFDRFFRIEVWGWIP